MTQRSNKRQEKLIFGGDWPSASQEETLEQTLETAITALSNLAYELGKVSAVLRTQMSTITKLKKALLLSYRQEAVGASGRPVVESSDSGSEDTH